jgi:tRNA pseudouridine13 synthase
MRNGDSLKLGDLQGNRFKLVLRELNEADDLLIEKGVNSLRHNGFVNYFGLQRFGNCVQIPTHLIGRYLIQNKIKEAIELILKPRESVKERDDVRQARALWHQFGREGAKQAFACIQNINCVEKFLLSGLSESDKNDYLGAFQYVNITFFKTN